MDDVKTKDQMIFNDPFAQRLLKKKKKLYLWLPSQWQNCWVRCIYNELISTLFST